MHIKQLEPRIFEVNLQETFDIDNERSFREKMKETLSRNPSNIFINLKDVEYIDSTALGLLMLYKQRANTQNCAITLIEPENEHVRSVLSLTKFDELFPLKKAN